ncbi:T9SS type A sorting domain-containing protein [Winogradskyella psychrotolerans]|nr:T9SS type A sorting domain-containing protein [Winogradskyella psychrotolerans]
MKTKLLTLLLFVLISTTMQSQTNTTDYVSGVIGAKSLTINGTDMYVLGSENIYSIDTTLNNPVPTVIYTVPNDFFLVNFTINGNLIYIALENYVQATDAFLGGKIVALDVNNLSNPVEDIYTTGEYISAITNDGSTLYITAETLTNPPSFDPFITHLDEIDSSISNPTAQLVVNNVTDTSVVTGITFDNGDIYLASSDDNEILKIDVYQSNPTVDLLTDFTFSRGLFKSGNELYLSYGSLITKIDITDPSAGSTAIAVNATYQDTNPNDGTQFFANFRDVILVGNKVYATLANQNKVVQAIDATLSTNEFDVVDMSIYNDKNNIYVNGLNRLKETQIFNVSGQLLMNKTVSPNSNSIDISTLSSGIYVMTVDNQKTFKFIK